MSHEDSVLKRLDQGIAAVFFNRSDMDRWVAAFPNHMNIDGEDDVIYEDWGEDYSNATAMCVCVWFVSYPLVYFLFFVPDCPQVQCVEQYIAGQADELTLEPTEIINVIRKTECKNMEKTRVTQHNIQFVMRILCFDKILHTLYANSQRHHSAHTH